jgi:hypothetical protein
LSTFFHHFLIGSAGAAAFEALKLWEFSGRLSEAKFRKLLRSLRVWLTFVAMLAASGFVAWAYHEKDPGASAWNVLTVGITARTLVRELISAKVAHERVKLGGSADSPQIRDYFR